MKLTFHPQDDSCSPVDSGARSFCEGEETPPPAEPAQPPATPPAAPPATDDEKAQLRAERDRLKAESDARKRAEAEARAAEKAKAERSKDKELETLRAEVAQMKAKAREAAVKSKLPRAIRDERFLPEFTKDLEFDALGQLTEAGAKTLEDRVKELDFLLVPDAAPEAPAAPDRSGRSGPSNSGKPGGAPKWNDQDQALFQYAHMAPGARAVRDGKPVFDPSRPSDFTSHPMFQRLNVGNRMVYYSEAAGGRTGDVQ